MSALMEYQGICMEEVDGELFVDSLQVAERFGKAHAHVMRDVEALDVAGESANRSKNGSIGAFTRSNFERVSYKDTRGRKQPKYLMTRDGFALLAMGFTGKDALEWKIAFIEAFNQMEKALLHSKGPQWALKRLEGKAVRRQLTDTIQAFVEYAAAQGSKTYKSNPQLAYIQFTRMEYAALFLLKQAVPGLREKLSLLDHNSLVFAERAVGRCIQQCMDEGMHYKAIYQECKKKVLFLAELAGESDLQRQLGEGDDE